MRIKAGAITAGALLALAVSSTSQAEINGLNCIDVPAQSDVRVSIPFADECIGEHTVTGKTANGLQVAGPLEAGKFNGLYYVRITSGTAEGRWATIDANTATDVNLLSTAFLNDVSPNDTFKIYAHQTLATAFPQEHKGFSYTVRPLAFNPSTEIQIPTNAVGINKSAGETYFYLNGAWRKSGANLTLNFGDTVLSPQRHFVIRNRDNRELSFCGTGVVEKAPQVTEVPVEAAANDFNAANALPVDRTLSQLNLGGTPAFKTTVLSFNVQDELIVVDNSAGGFNKSAAATYYYFGGAWRKTGEPTSANFNDTVIPAGSHLLLRKEPGAQSTVLWELPSPF